MFEILNSTHYYPYQRHIKIKGTSQQILVTRNKVVMVPEIIDLFPKPHEKERYPKYFIDAAKLRETNAYVYYYSRIAISLQPRRRPRGLYNPITIIFPTIMEEIEKLGSENIKYGDMRAYNPEDIEISNLGLNIYLRGIKNDLPYFKEMIDIINNTLQTEVTIGED